MPEWFWFLLFGGLLLFMAVGITLLQRLPMSTAIVYLALGVALGPSGFGVAELRFGAHAPLLMRAAEVVILLSLFSAGLKLRAPLTDARWRTPLRLALGAMVITIALIALLGHLVLALPLGMAVLLGAVLAPTDPVLASEVQVAHAFDQDRLRFGLTGEAALNDGAAFPFVMLALGLLGEHALGRFGGRWLAVDVAYGSLGGLALGWLVGLGAGRSIVWLRSKYKESVGLDDFLGLGLIATVYGLSLLLHLYGFLAVFAAGLAVREYERATRKTPLEDLPEPKRLSAPPDARAIGGQALENDPIAQHHPAADPETAAPYLAAAVLGFVTHLERLGEALIVTALGVLISSVLRDDSPTARGLSWTPSIVTAALAMTVARPVSVVVASIGCRATWQERTMAAWLGVRGVGSVYYLAYIIVHGLDGGSAEMLRVERAVLVAVAASIVLHGTSVTPLMRWYERSARPRAG